MFKTTGRLISKSILAEGKSSYGKWQLIEFALQKQFQGKRIKIPFVAFNEYARFIEKCSMKEKLKVYFFPKSTFHNGKYYTDLKVLEVDKCPPKKKKRIVPIDETQQRESNSQKQYSLESNMRSTIIRNKDVYGANNET